MTFDRPFDAVESLRRALVGCDSFERFSDLQADFSGLLLSGIVEHALLQSLEAIAGQSGDEPARDLLFDDPAGRLRLALCHTRPPSTLEGSACHQLIGVLRGHAELRRYSHCRRQDPAILDATCRLEPRPPVKLSVGDVLCAEAWVDLVEPYGDALLLYLQPSPTHATRWAYDRNTLAPIALVPGTRALGRIQDTLALLSCVGDADDAEVCVRLARHQSHAIRWQAITTACALDHPRAMTLLENARHDPHPEISEAAALALSQWN